MKKFFLMSFMLLTLFGCSLDNDTQNSFNVPLPIINVDIPESFQFGLVYPITVSYYRPTGCHIFNTFLVDNVENETTVVLINTVYEDIDCETFDANTNEVQAIFNYQVNSTENHVFKFWQGKDENDNDVYLIVDVPIEED